MKTSTVPQQLANLTLASALLVGLLFITNGYLSYYTDFSFNQLAVWKYVGEWLGSFLTLSGAALIAFSIYIDDKLNKMRKADRLSQLIAAPLVIISAVVSMAWMLYIQQIVIDVVNGFAILGLGGSILRMRPWSDLPYQG